MTNYQDFVPQQGQAPRADAGFDKLLIPPPRARGETGQGGGMSQEQMRQGYDSFCKSATQFMEELKKNPNSQEAQSAYAQLRSDLAKGPDGQNLVKKLDEMMKSPQGKQEVTKFLNGLIEKGGQQFKSGDTAGQAPQA